MVFFISPFRLDPRLRNRIRLLSNEDSRILLFQGNKNSEILQPFDETFVKKISVYPYDIVSESLSRVGKDDLVYVSTIRGFVETYGALRKVKSKTGARIVLEVADLMHRGFSIIDYILNNSVYIMMKHLVDLLVTTSPGFSEFFPGIRSIVVENIPNQGILKELAALCEEMPNQTEITFLGGFWYPEQLAMLVKYASIRPRINVSLFGGPERNLTDFMGKMSIHSYPDNVEYKGKYDYNAQVSEIYRRSSFIYAVYNARILNVRLALPNKLYESMAALRPIVVAKDTYLEKTIIENCSGFSVPYKHRHFKSFVSAMDEALEKSSSVSLSRDLSEEVVQRGNKQEREFVKLLHDIW